MTRLAALAVWAAALGPAATPARAAPVHPIRECGLPLARFDAGAPSFTQLWQASRAGWTGGDAALSTGLPDGRYLWVFGDSFLGGLRPDGTRDPGAGFVHNSVVVQDRDCLTTWVRGEPGAYDAFLTTGGDPYRTWYWPNQPLVVGRTAIVFLTRIVRTGPGGWDFRAEGGAVARLRLPGLAVASIRHVPSAPGTWFGSDVIAERHRAFVFGVDERRPGARGMLVARVAGGVTAPARHWRYWDGRRWSRDVRRAAPVAPLPSAQFSVLRYTPGARRLELVVQDGFSRRVRTFFAAVPQGPWREGRAIAVLPRIGGAIAYNATVHGDFKNGPDAIMSYCVNTYGNDFAGVERNPSLYRPRFLLVHLPYVPYTHGALNSGISVTMPGGAVTYIRRLPSR